MKNFRLLSIYVFAIIISLFMPAMASAQAPEPPIQLTSAGPQEWLSSMGNDVYWPVGYPTVLVYKSSDSDYFINFPYMYKADTSSCSLSTTTGDTWSCAPQNPPVNDVYTDTFTRTVTTPKYSDGTITVTASDGDLYVDDKIYPYATLTDKVVFWGPEGNIQGPNHYCPKASVSYCVQVGPASKITAAYGAKIYWYYTKTASEDDKILIGAGTYSNGYSSITMPTTLAPTGKDSQGNPRNSYKLWVRAEDGGRVTPWDYATTKSFIIDELPTDKSVCSEGNSCGSGGGGAASVDPKTGDVSVGSSLLSMVGPHASMIPLNAESGTQTCPGVSVIELFLYDGCNGTKIMHLHVYTSCGEVYCLNAGNFDRENYTVALLPNGDTLKKEDQGNNVFIFTLSKPNGAYEKHLTTVSSDLIYETRDANGNVTTGSMTGNWDGSLYTYTDSPAGGTPATSHKYTVVAGNLTHYEAVNVNNSVITSTNLAYDTNNRVTEITLNTPNELDKVRSMGYDSSGNLASVSQNGKITRYTRTTDAQGRLIVTVTIEDNQATLYGKTEYLFDTYTTTVTAKDAQNLLPDQDTIYHYMTDSSGNKRYMFMVESPVMYAPSTRDITVTKIHVPAGYYTEFGETSATANADYCAVADNEDSILWGLPITVTQIVGPPVTPPLTRATRIVQSYDTYDSFGNVTQISYPTVKQGVLGSTITETDTTPTILFTYNNSNQLIYKTDLDGSHTDLSYTGGRLTGELKTASDNVTTIYTTYEYNSNGSTHSKQVVTSTPSSSSTLLTEYTYNSNGLLQTETFTNSGVIQSIKTYDYLQGGIVQPGPTNVTTVFKDSSGNSWRTTTESSTYDTDGNLVSKTTPSDYYTPTVPGKTVSYSKTVVSNQKVERVVFASGVYTETVSDCCKVLYSTDIDGKTTNYVYDPIGRVVKTYTNDTGQSETTPLVQNTYDGFGRAKTVTTRSNSSTPRTTTYSYDILNRVTIIDNPGTLADEQSYYDVYGNLMAKSLGGGRTEMYKYDAMNRLTDIYIKSTNTIPLVYPTTSLWHKIYLKATNTVMAETTSNQQTKYTYNGLGQLVSVYWPLRWKTISYTYDTMGRKSSVSDGSNTTNYEYDSMGSLSVIKLGTIPVATYTTDYAGNRTHVVYGNTTWQDFSYGNDARYMLTGIDYAYKCNSGDTITNKGGIRITRTNGGNPLSWADNTDKFIKTFSYDNQGRLANADIPGVSRTDYGYDWVGNRTSPTAVYNDADQLTSDSGNTYSYNTYGDMTSGAGRSYSVDGLGMVYRITQNGETYNYGHNASGLRISIEDSADWAVYTYDVTASVPAVISEMHIWDDIYNYYVREPNGVLVMRLNGTDKKYYHFDELGNTLFLTDANGVQTDKYVYNAWGKVVSSSGSTVNPYKYVGQLGYYSDAGTGLMLLGSRFYDPEAGVFTQRDAAKDGISYYAYTSGKVMVATDPWGRTSLLTCDYRDRIGDLKIKTSDKEAPKLKGMEFVKQDHGSCEGKNLTSEYIHKVKSCSASYGFIDTWVKEQP